MLSTLFQHIGIAGAGEWGLALAEALSSAGRCVTLWGRDEAAMRAWRETRRGEKLPGVRLADAIFATSDFADLSDCKAILIVTPAQTTREVASGIVRALKAPRPLVICAKGVELGSNLFLSEVLAEIAPGWPRAALSGPSFAVDVAAGLPTAVTLAAEDETLAVALSGALTAPNLRLYHSTDLRGVELGGAAKNVLAIGCGVAAGLKLGASASAALIARGFAELRRFGDAYGARPQTLMGLSGLGDLVLTCSSAQSRNFSFGFALGRGMSPAEALVGKLAEGATTAKALVQLAREKNIEMPIAEAVEALIEGRLEASATVGAMLSRPLKGEA
jgi:glycerol-3-phosphate dehydrogenase (NAD(P)+)